jgi:tryptophan synthase beta chain
MVRDFQSVIGREAREQILAAEKQLPTYLFACVGGGSNAIGLFHQFLRDSTVKMVGIEAGGRGSQLGETCRAPRRASRFTGARPGVLQGTYTYILQTEDGQIATTHSISAGLDYPAIGPEHAWLADQAAQNTPPSPIPPRLKPRVSSRASKASSPRSNPPTPSPA